MFIQVRPGGRWIHILVVIWVGLVYLMRHGGRSVHCDPPWSLLGSFWFVQVIPVPTDGHWVHSGSFGSFLCSQGFDLFHSGASWGTLGSIGKFGCALGVAEFIRVRLG